MTQETMVAAWRDLLRLRQPDRFEPWLRRIVLNRAKNALRTRCCRPTESLGSADYRAAVILHYGADLSIRETADAMGVAVGTAKSRLNPALNHLRAALKADR